MFRFMMGLIGCLLALMVLVAKANASVKVDDDSGSAKFRVKGTTKVISPIEAQRLAPDHDIEKGTPIKGAASADGKQVEAYKWVEVDYSCKTKTGNCTWKRK